MKKRVISLLLAFIMLAGMLPQVSLNVRAEDGADILAGFTDLPDQSNWAYEGIAYCVENGYMNGMAIILT